QVGRAPGQVNFRAVSQCSIAQRGGPAGPDAAARGGALTSWAEGRLTRKLVSEAGPRETYTNPLDTWTPTRLVSRLWSCRLGASGAGWQTSRRTPRRARPL